MKHSIARIYYKHESKRKLQQLLLFDPSLFAIKVIPYAKNSLDEKVYKICYGYRFGSFSIIFYASIIVICEQWKNFNAHQFNIILFSIVNWNALIDQ